MTYLPRKGTRKSIGIDPRTSSKGVSRIDLYIGKGLGEVKSALDLEEVADLITILTYHHGVLSGAIEEET